MKAKRYVKKIQCISFDIGSYGDYYCLGYYKCLNDFDMHLEFIAWLESEAAFKDPKVKEDVLLYRIDPREQQELSFPTFLVDKGFLEHFDVVQYNIGNYSEYYSPVPSVEIDGPE